MKRLEKWLREIAEKLESEARSPPSGIIQMNSAILHHISKNIEQPFNLLLVPAHSFMSKVRNFQNFSNVETRKIFQCKNKQYLHIFLFLTIGSKISQFLGESCRKD